MTPITQGRTKKLLCLLFLFFCFTYSTQAKEIPDVVQFGGIKLKINQGAKRQIQTHINFLLRNKQVFQANIKAIELYMPMIDRILSEEGLPVDFKFLAIQENILVSDEKTPQNNGGFWNLKEELAAEIKLRINEKIDERLHLANSSRSVAKYLRRNNLHFKNWVFTMLTLELGYKEAREYVAENYNKETVFGVQTLVIDEKTHPYIRKFIAQKLVFESLIKQNTQINVKLVEYPRGANKTLAQIARRFGVSVNELKSYNKWLKKKRIPADRPYSVIIPPSSNTKIFEENTEKKDYQFLSDDEFVSNDDAPIKAKEKTDFQLDIDNTPVNNPIKTEEELRAELQKQEEEDAYKNHQNTLNSDELETTQKSVSENNLQQFHIIQEGQTLYSLYRMYGISVTELRNLNNLGASDRLSIGQKIWLSAANIPIISPSVDNQNSLIEKEESQNPELYHTVKFGETLYSLARRYNTSVAKLQAWNKLNGNIIQTGQQLIVSRKEENSYKILQSQAPDFAAPKNPAFHKKMQEEKIYQKLLNLDTEEGKPRGTSSSKKTIKAFKFSGEKLVQKNPKK